MNKHEKEIKVPLRSYHAFFDKSSEIPAYLIRNPGLQKIYYYRSYLMRKPAFCICENKGVDQLHGYS